MMKTTALPPWPARAAWALLPLLALALAACAPHDDAHKAAPSASAGAGAAASASALADKRYVAIARGRVDVPGGLLRVATPYGGLIERWGVEPGATVKQGQVLAQLDTREPRTALELAKAEHARAVAQLEVVRTELLVARARRERAIAAPLPGTAGTQALEDARFAVVYAGQQLAAQETAVLVEKQRVDQATQVLAAATVRAPANGQVVQRIAQVGEYVEPHGLVLHLLPDGPRIVRADLNEALIARVQVGMRAEVVSVAEDSAVHGARVLNVGEVFGPPRTPDTAGSEEVADNRVVECLLQLDDTALRVGQRVLVRFLPAQAAEPAK
jgi:multidrug efflux pump subunit AcrA (membrane-fusion protein)